MDNKITTLQDLLKDVDHCTVEYRKRAQNGEDILLDICNYENGKLISENGIEHSLQENINIYTYNSDKTAAAVWIESNK